MPYADMELNTIGFYVHYGRICMKKQWKIKNKYQEWKIDIRRTVELCYSIYKCVWINENKNEPNKMSKDFRKKNLFAWTAIVPNSRYVLNICLYFYKDAKHGNVQTENDELKSPECIYQFHSQTAIRGIHIQYYTCYVDYIVNFKILLSLYSTRFFLMSCLVFDIWWSMGAQWVDVCMLMR